MNVQVMHLLPALHLFPIYPGSVAVAQLQEHGHVTMLGPAVLALPLSVVDARWCGGLRMIGNAYIQCFPHETFLHVRMHDACKHARTS